MAGIIDTSSPIPSDPTQVDPTNVATPTSALATTPTQIASPAPAPTSSATSPANPAATYKPTLADPSASNWSVGQNQTVAGQMGSLTSAASPFVQQAVTASNERMNERGMLNSSMATTAGQSAAYQAALPIAQSDAGTFAKAAAYNSQSQNQDISNNANAVNSANQFNAGQVNSLNQSNAAQVNAVNLQNLQSKNQILLNTNTQASSAFQYAVSALNNIANSTTMDAATKTSQSQQIYANLQTQLRVTSATSGLDLPGILGGNPYAPAAPAPGAPPPAAGAPYVAPAYAQPNAPAPPPPKDGERGFR